MTDAANDHHAVVLAGTGANAAYEVGVMKALSRTGCAHLGGEPIEPLCYAGLSIGSFDAAVMASRCGSGSSEAVEFLERLWLDRIASTSTGCGNGFFRFRANPLHYLSPSCFLPNPLQPMVEWGVDGFFVARDFMQRAGVLLGMTEPLEERVLRAADLSTAVDIAPMRALIEEAVDLGRLASGRPAVRVTAANWELGEPHTFGNEDLEGERGFEAILAAAAIPGVVPPQHVGDELYVDAAVLMGDPLRPAIDALRAAGGDGENEPSHCVLHLIYLDPGLSTRTLPRLPDTFSTVIRLYATAFANCVTADMRRAAAINDNILFHRLYGEGEGTPAGGLRAKQVLKRLHEQTENRVELTIHRYRPARTQNGFLGLLQFDRERLAGLIKAGYDDTRRHDCEKEGCLLAG